MRLPFAPPTRTLLRAADAAETEHLRRMPYQNCAGTRLQRNAGLNMQYYHPSSSFLPEAHERYSLTDKLVGDALQLGRYMDPAVVEVARRELAEAYELDDRQLDYTAFRLTAATAAAAASGNLSSNGNASQYGLSSQNYLEHVGGYAPEEVNDINQYSQHSLLRPAINTVCLNSGIVPSTTHNQSQNKGEHDSELLLVTTL